MKKLCALVLLVAATVSAQTEPTPRPADPPKPTDGKAANKPEPKPGTPVEEVFRPSEEVSADKEIDFPADL